MIKLKPCPFCGKKAEVKISLGRDIVSCTNCHAEMAGSYINIDSLIEEWNTRESPAVNRWIPCSERLPEVWKEVLVVLNSNGYQSIHVGEMQESGDWMVSGEFWYDKGDPTLTHWMPLPEPPEKE